MDARKVVGAMVIILAIFGVSVYVYYFAYGRTAMASDIINAKEYLWRARSIVNLETQADYMKKALESLENRRGNPNWLFKFPDTDFDFIKNDLQTNIASALNISKTEVQGSYGYQRAIDNIQEICVELNGHLDLAINWCTDFLPFTIGFNIIGWGCLITLVLYLSRTG